MYKKQLNNLINNIKKREKLYMAMQHLQKEMFYYNILK